MNKLSSKGSDLNLPVFIGNGCITNTSEYRVLNKKIDQTETYSINKDCELKQSAITSYVCKT